MRQESIERWRHEHMFLGADHEANARRLTLVVWLTAAAMAAEIVGGALFGSMALIADGLHMSTHAGALGIAAAAYAFARRFKNDPRFAFGTGKLGDLAGFASAAILVMIALLIAYESVLRLFDPIEIAYGQAIAIAFLGLAVNLLSAWILQDSGLSSAHSHAAHERGHEHVHPHPHGGFHAHAEDNNLRAAYVHVLADAATSLAAIGGLIGARSFNLPLIDPIVALLGTVVILSWAVGLLRSSGAVLLDCVPDQDMAVAIRRRLETEGDEIADLHLWRLGPGHQAAVISIVSDLPKAPMRYKERLTELQGISHITIEVNPRSEASSSRIDPDRAKANRPSLWSDLIRWLRPQPLREHRSS